MTSTDLKSVIQTNLEHDLEKLQQIEQRINHAVRKKLFYAMQKSNSILYFYEQMIPIFFEILT